ncbi:BglG family transcription antiterminator LicT [Inconstantimicrobium mannanitabidum]|uniref:Transcription antiterminator BglG n=1 Tax=Inconstantimicrobium mannanitabidum TaxID=1604901 RepID=A0ACB5RDQ0_9CLOT|nr:PRD domain-containing protein [Clostridium sp. TW13]GKX67168.1 transcription antiterminator BglG [Clostridium sp. TW13]
MNIRKILNNSLILAEDENKKEIIVMGKGLGFNSKVGDVLEKEKIEKIFVLKNETTMKEYVRLIEQTPSEYVEITNYIINYANRNLGKKLSDQLFITLIDHISYAIERYKKNITIQNRLIWEVKKFYPKEFEIGIYSVKYINEKLNIELLEEEAANIAFHIVNAQTDEGEMQNTLLTVKLLKAIFNIVQYNLGIKIDKDSINYSRFLTHLQFFIQRLLDGKIIESRDSFIFNQITKEYPVEFKCAKLIEEYIKNALDKEISYEELLYLTIHIVRINQK